jgi:hypothetical protein
MDSNQLIVGLVQALAWPLIAFFIVLLLRKPFIELFKNVEKLKWQGVEFEFGQKLVNAEKDARGLSLPPAEKVKLPAFKQDMSLYEKMKSIAEISPAAAVADSWKAVEFATMEAAKVHGYDISGRIVGYKIVEKLAVDGLLDEGTLGLYRDLRSMRNSAAHHSDFSITVSEALRYIDLSLSLANKLQGLANSERIIKGKKK